MAKHGKKFRSAAKKVDENMRYSIMDACNLVKEAKVAKFDESVDIAINLGVDPRHADQNIRGAVSLPHGTGKTIRVAVFAKGAKAKEAEDAGADVVGGEELAQRIEAGFMDFDKVVASPDMMAVVGKLGKVLGPRGLMPNPKNGTVHPDPEKRAKELSAGEVNFKTEPNNPIIHLGIGKVSFEADQLLENIKALILAIGKHRIARVTLSSTMGPGIKVDLAAL